MKLLRIAVTALCVFALVSSTSSNPPATVKLDYVEACSCHLFCPCYFNKQAEHPYCEFNMAVKVRHGAAGKVNLAGAQYWLTGDLGNDWGSKKRAKWVFVTFDPKVSKEQRDALAPMILKTYGFEWGELKIQEAPVEVKHTGDIVEAKLGGGKLAYMKLKKLPGADGKGVVLKNVKYFDAPGNDGFAMYKSIEHSANLPGHKFKYSDRNAFLISLDAPVVAASPAPAAPAKK